jgi:hypothetical protein
MGIFSSVGAVRRCWGLVSVAGQFPGAEREADRGDLMQIELAEHRSQVGGEGVEVVARRRPAGPAEAAPVVDDHPIPCVEEHRHLRFPRPAVERPPVQ